MMSRRKILAAALAATTAGFLPGVAHAQLVSPCLVLGSPLPPPCITFDYKKLADIATQNAHELQKIQQTVATIQQARTATQGIISDAKALTSFNITGGAPLPTLNLSPILDGFSGTMSGVADRVGSKLFSAADGTSANLTVTNARAAVAADANADAMAYALTAPNEATIADKRYCKLAKKMQASGDLRTDWAINSEIKLELMNARSRQSYLMSEFLKLQAANNVSGTTGLGPKIRAALPRIGLVASAIAIKALTGGAPTDQSDKVSQLQDLYARAQSIMGSLGVVQMTTSIQATLQGVIDDYQGAATRKAQAMSSLQSQAQQWRNNSGKGSSSNTVSVVLANLSTMDDQLSALRAQPIETLGGAFAARNIDVNAMTQNDVDPRQFIGTWTDPNKYNLTNDMSNALLRGTLDSSISGSGDEQAFRQAVYNYNDVRLEEAWKKPYADEARAKLVETGEMIAEENTKQGGTVSEQGATEELQSIVARANALGKEISDGSDDGSKVRASDILNSLQTLVGGGTSLPAVDAGAGAQTPTQPVPAEDPEVPAKRGDPTIPLQ